MENVASKNNINNILKIVFIILAILLITPSVIYLVQNKTIYNFNTYYNFFINKEISKTISTTTYLILFIAITAIYLRFVIKKSFENIKQVLIYTSIIGAIFLVMLPWTSSDIFYYMGVGELNSVYGQNPYYVTMKQYYSENKGNIQDEVLEQGAHNYWADTTVVYGPIAQLIFSVCAKLSLKNINLCLFIFKLVNLLIHILNCYLIYKLTKKLKFSVIYGLNPFILIEFIGNVHNDIIIIFLILLSTYFLLKKKNLNIAIVFLAIATGVKYFTILLLPVAILYHFRKEKSILKRLARCIQYGIMFLCIFMAEYIIYFRDVNVLTAMLVQNEKYSKSIYSAMYSIEFLSGIRSKIRDMVFLIFVVVYIKFCIDLLTTKEIKFYKAIRKYNYCLILFYLSLTTFQQWYLVWAFATIMWQKPNMIKNIIGISTISELANSVYMYKFEHYKYDIYFVEIIMCLFVIWQICTNRFKGEKKIEKVITNRWK